jgi:hypothetical protein
MGIDILRPACMHLNIHSSSDVGGSRLNREREQGCRHPHLRHRGAAGNDRFHHQPKHCGCYFCRSFSPVCVDERPQHSGGPVAGHYDFGCTPAELPAGRSGSDSATLSLPWPARW